jgi:competence protein ComEA
MLSRIAVTRAEAAALLLLALAGVAGVGVLWWAQQPGPELTAGEGLELLVPEAATTPTTTEVVVHVAGLVVTPGVHRLPPGSRVADAIEAAGGARPEAFLDGLNLARPLTDGEQLLVPAEPPEGTAPPGPPAAAGLRSDGTVDLNTATQAELETLPGVGPVTAQRIIEHREANGPFASTGQLREVRGIGEKTFQALADLVSV